MTIGARIRVYRKQRGYTQARLAEMIGVDRHTISRWERFHVRINIKWLVPLAICLQVSADTLLGLDGDKSVAIGVLM